MHQVNCSRWHPLLSHLDLLNRCGNVSDAQPPQQFLRRHGRRPLAVEPQKALFSMASNPLTAAQLSGIPVAASQPFRQAIVGDWDLSAMSVPSEPFLQARYGAEGLRVERDFDC